MKQSGQSPAIAAHSGWDIVKIALPAGKFYPAAMIQNDIPDHRPTSDGPDGSERLLALLAYGLLLIAPPSGGLTAVIGVVIAHVRLSHAAGTRHESHYRNQIRVFWTLFLYAVAMTMLLSMAMGLSLFSLLTFWPVWPVALAGQAAAWMMFMPLAALLSFILVIWYYWRLLRGFVRALDDKPY